MIGMIVVHMHNGDGITDRGAGGHHRAGHGDAARRPRRPRPGRCAACSGWRCWTTSPTTWRAGDLLLTTAYNLRDEPELQRRAGRADGRSAASSAMVVKCGYYLERGALRRAPPGRPPSGCRCSSCPARWRSSRSRRASTSGWSAAPTRGCGARPTSTASWCGWLAEGARLARIVRRAAALLGNPVLVEDARGRPLAGFLPVRGEPLGRRAAGRRRWRRRSSPGACVHGRVLLLPRAADRPTTTRRRWSRWRPSSRWRSPASEQELRAERERLADVRPRPRRRRADAARMRSAEAAVLGVELPTGRRSRCSPRAGATCRARPGAARGRPHRGRASPRAPRSTPPAASPPATDGVAGLPDALARAERAWRIGARARRRAAGCTATRRCETYDALVGHLAGEQLTGCAPAPSARLPAAAAGDAGGVPAMRRQRRPHGGRGAVRAPQHRALPAAAGEQLTGLDSAPARGSAAVRAGAAGGAGRGRVSADTASGATCPPTSSVDPRPRAVGAVDVEPGGAQHDVVLPVGRPR